eukprot:gnl/TRDRNA2_/TRDRNA2_91936_c0_seq1.p1 gnl/TRDRNA2_/TRDRNA2_91936_c0~~gnl/TRDRNA2_/TRDRNA2_91936_c0_seq1.p1  ORF type:complete len:423 (+),score=39.85 gnl/TRDRNA2_/TRDRNA2_91936_c0_seq1:2-1270(+)
MTSDPIEQTICHLQWASRSSEGEPHGADDGEVYGHAAVVVGRTVWVLGGIQGGRTAIATHAFDLDTRIWTDCTPRGAEVANGHAPCRRWGQSVCLIAGDASADEACSSNISPTQLSSILLCGGFDSQCNHGDAWLLDPGTVTFHQPCRRRRRLPVHGAYHSLVFDIERQEALLFGGQCCRGGPYEFYNQVFFASFALSDSDRHEERWRELAVAGSKPAPRAQHMAVMVGAHMLIYGGADARSGFRDVWTLSLDRAEVAWTELRAAGGPPPSIDTSLTPRDFRVQSCRPFVSVHGHSLLVLARDERTRLGLFIFDLHSRQWHAVSTRRAPRWLGNFAAWSAPVAAASTSCELLVFGGHRQRHQGGDHASDVGLWALTLRAQPSELVMRTLLIASKSRGRFVLPLESLQHVFSFLRGHVADVIV